jgi:hypothetical protein
MKNFPNSIKVIKREGSGYRSIVDYMGQTWNVREFRSKMLNVRKHLGDLGADEKPVLE